MVDTINLDFNTIKTSLKTFLKSQTKFVDYNFEASNMTVLIDLLAYNASNTGFFTNMAISEMFLDTAKMKESVVSHAKMLNYMPSSRKSAAAVVDVTIDTTGFPKPSSLIIPKGTKFRTIINGKAFTFTTNSSVVMDNLSGSNIFTYKNLSLFEGKYLTDYFSFNGSFVSEKFLLSSDVIDIDSIEVSVQNSSSDLTKTIWKYTPTVLGLTTSSEVFFLQPSDKNKYSVTFGDDIISKALVAGNIISVNYRVSRTDESFGANFFKPVSSIQGFSAITVVTIQPASGGSERENIASIKLNAPKHFQTQDRAITASDFETLLTKEFPSIQTLSVYGGENLNPPQFGKVVVVIDMLNSNGISDVLKTEVAAFLKTKSSISITPIVLNPEFIFLQVSGTVSYDISSTTKTPFDIEAKIVTDILSYNTTTVNKFNSALKYTSLATVIDNSETSITSSDFVISPYIKIAPADLTIPLSTSVYNFFNEIKQVIQLSSSSDYAKFEAPVYSTSFISNGTSVFIEDDGSGTLQLVTIDTSGKRVVYKDKIGIVDYVRGSITLNEIQIDSYTGDGIRLFILPKNKDFTGTQNKIISIDPNIKLSLIGTRS